MFDQLKNLGGIMKQAQQMGEKMQEINRSLKDVRATAETGGGLVAVEVNGLGEVLAVRIDPTLLGDGGDREMLEDLLVGAVNQALAKSKKAHAEAISQVTGGLNLPGLDEAIKHLGT